MKWLRIPLDMWCLLFAAIAALALTARAHAQQPPPAADAVTVSSPLTKSAEF